MAVMVIANLTIVTHITCKIGCYKSFHIPAAATYDLDSLGFKDILCPLSHIAGKHDLHTPLFQDGGYTALASASFRRCHFTHTGYLIVYYIENRIICAVAEMIVHASVSCWYCYLHIVKNIVCYCKDTDFCYFCI